jgi:hypothetical protein
MFSAIYESGDLGYLIFVICGFISFFLLVKFFPKDKNYRSKRGTQNEQ